jgi:DNA-binding winged helix-turn-helix (wHTH) protein
MDLIEGPAWVPLDRTIDNQVARLRRKIERDPSQPRLIKTIRGIGYMLTVAAQPLTRAFSVKVWAVSRPENATKQ